MTIASVSASAKKKSIAAIRSRSGKPHANGHAARHTTTSRRSSDDTVTSLAVLFSSLPRNFVVKGGETSCYRSSTTSSILEWRALAIGTVGGFVTSMAGLGGALVMIPVLTTTRLSQHAAHGTALCAVAVTAVTGAWTYREHLLLVSDDDDEDRHNDNKRSNNNNTTQLWTTTAILAVTGMVTARYGARLTTRLSAPTLQRALGSLMLLLSAAVAFKEVEEEDNLLLVVEGQPTTVVSESRQQQQQQQQDDTEPRNTNELLPLLPTTTTSVMATTAKSITSHENFAFWQDEIRKQCQYAIPMAVVGSASGLLAGLFGVGGGTLVVPALTLLSSSRPSSSSSADAPVVVMTQYQILATSLWATSLPAVVGAYTHYRAGNVVVRWVPSLAVGAAVGAAVGGTLGQQLDESTLRTGLTVLLAVLGVRTLGWVPRRIL